MSFGAVDTIKVVGGGAEAVVLGGAIGGGGNCATHGWVLVVVVRNA